MISENTVTIICILEIITFDLEIIIYIMKTTKTVILLCLISISLTQTTIVYSEPLSTSVSQPYEGLSQLDKYHNVQYPDYLGKEAKWIWTKKPSPQLSATF